MQGLNWHHRRISSLGQTFSSLPLVADYEQSALTEVVERSLLSLLLIPLIALVFLLVWKVRWPSTTLGAKLLGFSVKISARFTVRTYESVPWNLRQPAATFYLPCLCSADCCWCALQRFEVNTNFSHPCRPDHEEVRRTSNGILERTDSSQERKGPYPRYIQIYQKSELFLLPAVNFGQNFTLKQEKNKSQRINTWILTIRLSLGLLWAHQLHE